MMEQQPKAPKSIKEFSQDGRILLVDPDRPAWAMVNRLGKEIAGLCNGKRTAGDITTIIAEKYSVSEEMVSRDVGKFLGMLEKARLVHYGEAVLIERRNLADEVGPIASACFELTERCNLKCMHCFEEAGLRTQADPSTEEVISWIDKFLEVSGININLSGGEFLTRSDWREIVGHVAEAKATAVILTNGTLVTDEIATELARITEGAPFTFQVSLDGCDPETNDPVRGTGSFERIVGGIRTLRDHGLGKQIAISFTPNRLNIGKLDEMVNLALDLGVPTFHISILHRMGRAAVVWRKLKPTTAQMIEFFDGLHTKGQELEGRLRMSGDFCSMLNDKVKSIPSPITLGCRLGVDLKVAINGDVYPCPPMSYDKKYCIGNMRETDVEGIRHSTVLRELRELFVPRVEQSPGCRTCAWKCFCAGGCMGRAELNYGTIFHGDDLCGLAKEMYTRTFFRQAEMQRRPADAQTS